MFFFAFFLAKAAFSKLTFMMCRILNLFAKSLCAYPLCDIHCLHLTRVDDDTILSHLTQPEIRAIRLRVLSTGNTDNKNKGGSIWPYND